MSKTAAPACKERGGRLWGVWRNPKASLRGEPLVWRCRLAGPPYIKDVRVLHSTTCPFLPCVLTFPQNLLK